MASLYVNTTTEEYLNSLLELNGNILVFVCTENRYWVVWENSNKCVPFPLGTTPKAETAKSITQRGGHLVPKTTAIFDIDPNVDWIVVDASLKSLQAAN